MNLHECYTHDYAGQPVKIVNMNNFVYSPEWVDVQDSMGNIIKVLVSELKPLPKIQMIKVEKKPAKKAEKKTQNKPAKKVKKESILGRIETYLNEKESAEETATSSPRRMQLAIDKAANGIERGLDKFGDGIAFPIEIIAKAATMMARTIKQKAKGHHHT